MRVWAMDGKNTYRRLKEGSLNCHGAVLMPTYLCLAACATGRGMLLSLARGGRTQGWNKVEGGHVPSPGLRESWPGEAMGREMGEPQQLMQAGVPALKL